MEEQLCCAVLGHHPMRFAWGFDEEDKGCRNLKLVLAQKIMELRQQNVTRFAVVADCGIGLYARETINALREHDADLTLFVVTPHEEQSTKWAPYLRERYFDLLIKCTHIEAVSLRKTATCDADAYRKIIDYADFVLAVYDPTSVRNDAVDQAMHYAQMKKCNTLMIHPDTMITTVRHPILWDPPYRKANHEGV